ncbi:MAG: flagellar basal body rod protein FlgB [Verrucomicrobia bacterium]|nr:MAG: flagellar basal body rod protein FlgB [Verrucomicrobiota bacterium]
MRGMIESVMARETYVLAKKMLDAAALRHELIATNLANAETPGFKRLDLDSSFSQQLNTLMQKGDLGAARNLEIKSLQDPTAKSSRPDGNNIELDRELLEMNRNALEYDFLAQYTSDSLKRIKTAITGRVT